MKNNECEEFVCELKSVCKMAYLGAYFCSHYCQTTNCDICREKENCNLLIKKSKKNDEFRKR